MVFIEETNITTGECIQGLSIWNSASTITYYAITNSMELYAEITGIRVQVNTTDTNMNPFCPNGQSTVNYDIRCVVNETVFSSVYEAGDCHYTVNIRSEYGCVNREPINHDYPEYNLNMHQNTACKGSSSIHSLGIDKIEWDLGNLGSPAGFVKPDPSLHNQEYRLSLCGGLQDAASKCTHERFMLRSSKCNGKMY